MWNCIALSVGQLTLVKLGYMLIFAKLVLSVHMLVQIIIHYTNAKFVASKLHSQYTPQADQILCHNGSHNMS